MKCIIYKHLLFDYRRFILKMKEKPKWMYAILAVFLMISSVACGREDDTPAADGTTASKMDGAEA